MEVMRLGNMGNRKKHNTFLDETAKYSQNHNIQNNEHI